MHTNLKHYSSIHTIGNFEITFIDAPGHSEGSSMILWDDNLFSGDVLFQGSIGRTDLATSSNTKMMQSLRKSGKWIQI